MRVVYDLTCSVCQGPFTAKRTDALYCSERCRGRAAQRRANARQGLPAPRLRLTKPGEVPPDVADPNRVTRERKPEPEVPVVGLVEAATLAELEAGHRVGSLRGQAALVLARRIDNSQGDTAAGLAGMVRELGQTVDAAMKGAPVQDEVFTMRERVAAKRAGGAS